MKLKLFDKVDDTIKLLEQNREEYRDIRKELKYTLLSLLSDEDVIDITTRIKTADSLKEKIIRNQYYLKYETPEEILNNLSDLIGLKIDCRFIEEEFKIFSRLKESFHCEQDEGYCTSEKFPHIALELKSLQPQTQRNGFSIYRIDGYYDTGRHWVRFELQIKSLVNSFWGDIEHRLVYKNTSYVIYDSFMIDLLATIKANLTIIDRQLHIIYDSMQSNNSVSSSFMDKISFEELISKAINDLCAEKLRETLGFTINIKETSNILGHYIFKKNIQSANDDDQIVSLLQLFGRLSSEEIDFENEILMENRLTSEDPFTTILGNHLLDSMNKDFTWFVFFRILFAIEPGNNAEDFNLFLFVLKGYLIDLERFECCFDKLPVSDADAIKQSCLLMFSKALCAVGDIQIVHNSKTTIIRDNFNNFLNELEERVINYKDFQHYESSYYQELDSIIKDIFK